MSWRTLSFGQFAEIQPKVPLERGDEYPFFPMEIVEPCRRDVIPVEIKKWDGGGGARFQNDDTIFARITPCLEHGKIALIRGIGERGGFGSTEFFVFRRKFNVSDSEFIYYLASSKVIREPAIKSMVGASGRQRAQRRVIEEIQVKVPPLDVQRKIASILSAYDNLIENNRRRIALLEESVLLLYREWFVYLRFPGHEHGKVVSGVPEGWKHVTVPEIIEINPTEKLPKNKEIWYVPMASLSATGMTANRSNFELRTGHTTVKFRNGDVLLARITPCLENGKTGFVYFLNDDEVACGSTEFIVLRGKLVSPAFTYCLARSHDFRENAIKSMIGSSGRQRVQASCFNEYWLPLPPSLLLQEFDLCVGDVFSQIRNLVIQNEKLVKARDLLLPRLMSGEIAV